jgi:hypothetical protein
MSFGGSLKASNSAMSEFHNEVYISVYIIIIALQEKESEDFVHTFPS